MEKTDVALIGYADFNTSTGESFTSLATYLDQHGVLSQIIHRGGSSSNTWNAATKQAIPGGGAIPKLLSGLETVNAPLHARYYAEELFDIFAARKLNTDVDAVIHFTPGHKRLMSVCDQHDIPVIFIAGIEHTQTVIWRDIQERHKLGLNLHIPKTRAKMAQQRCEQALDADHVICMSEFSRNSFEHAGVGSENLSATPIAVDAEKYPPGEQPEETFMATFAGTVSHLKGIHYFLEAWQNLEWSADERARLDLCGNVDNIFRPYMNAQSIQNLYCHGWVDPLPYYQRAAVFVFPTVTDGFGKAPLEAMATGTPVIVTENCGIPDLITDGEEGFIVPASDADAIADRLAFLRNHPEQRVEMGQRAAETARAHDWSHFGETVQDTIQRMVS